MRRILTLAVKLSLPGWAVLGTVVAAQTPAGVKDGEPAALIARYETGALSSASEIAATAAAYAELGRDDPQLFHRALEAYDRAIAADPADLEIRVALGELFLAKFNSRDARATFEEALELDAEHPGALLGLARTRRFDGATDVFEITGRILQSHPDHLGARLLEARQYLDLEAHAAAETALERALAIAPSSPEAHALASAVALLEGDDDELRRRLEKAATAAPGDPGVFVVLAELAARHRLYRRAVDFAARAVEIEPRSWRGWALRGVNRLRVGEIEPGRRDLETAFTGDPFDLWTKNTLDLLDQMKDHAVLDRQILEDERFELVIPEAEADLLALYLVPLAVEAYDAMAARYGVELAKPLRIELFARHADFSVRTIGLAGLGALGVSFGPVVALLSPASRPAGELHWGTVLWHELAHSFHMAKSAQRVPRWFTEGLAVWEERQARPGWGDRVDPAFLAAYREDRLAPVADLNQGFMRPAYPQQIAFSYLQSSLVFDFIIERWGFNAVLEMLSGYADGRDTAAVFQDVFELDLAAFARAYDKTFLVRFAAPLAAMEASGEPAEVMALLETSPRHEEWRARAAELAENGDFASAAAALENAQYFYPYEEADHRQLAEWYEDTGQLAAAVRERRAVLALAPFNRAAALFQLARLEWQLGEGGAARRHLLAALELAPGHEEALDLLLEMRAQGSSP